MAKTIRYRCDQCGKELEAPAVVPEGYASADDPKLATWFQIGARLLVEQGKGQQPQAVPVDVLEACSSGCADKATERLRRTAVDVFASKVQADPRKPLGLDMNLRTLQIMVEAPAARGPGH